MDILPIQASAVPSERVFSSSKETTTQRRSRITGEHMEEIQVLKFAINRDQLSFTSGTSREDEINLLGSNETMRSVVPEDLVSFLKSLTIQ